MASVIKGDKELMAKLAKLKDWSALSPTLTAMGVHIKGRISAYPMGNQHRPQPFVSEKQRKYFFWALREGLIEVPYRRGQSPGSEDLAQSWWTKSEGALKVLVGNDTSYGPLVQGPGTQTAYHQATGWKTTDDVVEEESEFVLNEIKKKVDQILAS